MDMLAEFKKDDLQVKVFKTSKAMGEAASAKAKELIGKILSEKDEANIMFAAGHSQDDFLDALSKMDGIDWKKVNAFHMDEYIGVGNEYPQKFGKYLNERIFSKWDFKNIFYIDGNADVHAEMKRYSDLLKKYPLDIAFIGIGENGHIAFNDPHVAKFNDHEMIKVVQMDQTCRQQQVRDGFFDSVNLVADEAITVTIPTLFNSRFALIIVPGDYKANIIKKVFSEDISEKVPATIMRTHKCAELFLDKESASLLKY
jgi:glucosamine-6-phosphate deaminase